MPHDYIEDQDGDDDDQFIVVSTTQQKWENRLSSLLRMPCRFRKKLTIICLNGSWKNSPSLVFELVGSKMAFDRTDHFE
jgi:hypothetical protein